MKQASHKKTSCQMDDPMVFAAELQENLGNFLHCHLGQAAADDETLRIVLACSAGSDSMAMLRLFAKFAGRHDVHLIVAHLDHAQREASVREAAFVQEVANGLGLDFVVERLAVAKSKHQKASEASMREARYTFLQRVAEQRQAHAIAVAHHADDRAETLLMRLADGSGMRGLSSPRPVESLGQFLLIRPLLHYRRDALRAWLRAIGQEWIDDPSNEDDHYRRNWYRKEIIPRLIEQEGEKVIERIANTAELINQEYQASQAMTRLILNAMHLETADVSLSALDQLSLKNPLWLSADARVKSTIIREWLSEHSPSGYPPGTDALAQVMTFIEVNRRHAILRTIGNLHILHFKRSIILFSHEISYDKIENYVESLKPDKKTQR